MTTNSCAMASSIRLSDLVDFHGSTLQGLEIEESAGSPAKQEQQQSDSVRSWQHSIWSRGYAIMVFRGLGLSKKVIGQSPTWQVGVD